MNQWDMLFSYESAFLLGQTCLVIALLALRADPNAIYRPLILFFVANVFNQVSQIIEPLVGQNSSLYVIADILTIPANLTLAPALWLYVRGLTSETPHRLSGRDMIHFVPTCLALIVCLVLFVTPEYVRDTLIGAGNTPQNNIMRILVVSIVLLMITWVCQVLFYVGAIMKRIIRYRSRLRDVFASTDGRELHWIVWLIVLLTLSVLVFIPDFLFDISGSFQLLPLILDLALFMFLAIWGLRQMPGFVVEGETELSQTGDEPLSVPLTASGKYEKSALTPADMERIAEKIGNSMREDALYLEPDLSLRILAKHISVTPNYVSQSLNGHIGESFFDYINRWRIEHAMPMLVQSGETVLNIAYSVGFNSRSSFYKAFKRETGLTPSAYRKNTTSDKDSV